MDALSGLTTDRDRRESYVAAALDRLSTAGPVRDAKDDWASFVRATHGDVFEQFPQGGATAWPGGADTDRAPVDASDRAFAAVLYVDFLLERLREALEDEIGVELANPNACDDTDALSASLGSLHERVCSRDPGPTTDTDRIEDPLSETVTPGRLGSLYSRALPRDVRFALGEFYTPRGVADLAMEALDREGALRAPGDGRRFPRLLDPGCGTGVFLVAAIAALRARASDAPPERLVDALTDAVVGIDANPVAVKAAKLAVFAAIGDRLATTDREVVHVPVYLADALGPAASLPTVGGDALTSGVDALVGNPPWIPWERLAAANKERWREEYVTELGLQPHDGVAARLGHNNDDVSVPFAWTCLHRFLRSGGAASFVLKRDSMRGPAGAVLRRLQVGNRALSLRHVHDFAAVEPFPSVGANAAVYTLVADADATFPVPATVWTAGADAPQYGSGRAIQDTLERRETELVPLAAGDPASPWIRTDAEQAALGTCSHEIRHGVKDDASDVFGLDRETAAALEPTHVYPYLKSRHVRKYGLTGHDLRLVPQRRAGADNEATLRTEAPRTYDYLTDHRETLRDRSSAWLDRGPFYSVFGLGPYTWREYKVVWCRLGFKPDFAVVSTRTDPDLGEQPVVPGDHYMYVATDHRRAAHFLCALLNAAPYQRTLRDLASDGKASLTKAVVSELALPPWPDSELGERLADLSIAAHDRVRGLDPETAAPFETDPELGELQASIDRLVADALESGAFGR